MIKCIKEIRKIANHYIARSIITNERKYFMGKVNVALSQIRTVSYGTVRNVIMMYTLNVYIIQQMIVVLINASVNVCSITNFTLLVFFSSAFEYFLNSFV